MTLPVPPRYAVVPQEIGDQAYALDKPKRALFADFQRILSLAWKSKFKKTPAMNEQELWEWLKLSRRQYFEKKAEMEAMGWLRSTHPRTGFVQFDFSRSFTLRSAQDESAENRTPVRKTALDALRTEEEESINSLNIKPSSSLKAKSEVRKTALASEKATKKADTQLVTKMISNLHLVFDPFKHGVLEVRKEFKELAPDHVLGWIVKAYQDRERIEKRNGSPIGLLVSRLRGEEAPSPFLVEHAPEILPEGYLEKIGKLSITCSECDQCFSTRSTFEAHLEAEHPVEDEAEEVPEEEPELVVDPSAREPISGSMNAEQAWQNVLGQLSMEMPKASFDAWVRETRAVRFDGNTLLIGGVKNSLGRDWLESRLTSTVERLLIGILNQDVKVIFSVDQMQMEEV